jgi:outer membrane protein TolC
LTIQQAYPLGGKRDLSRAVAQAEARQAGSRAHSTEVELAARIKTLFAQTYETLHAIGITEDILQLLRRLAELAESRYARGLGGQADILAAQVERINLETDLKRRREEHHHQRVRMNAILNRPVELPLAQPRALRVLPDPERLDMEDLRARILRSNPTLTQQAAALDASRASRRLVDKNRIPDLFVGFGLVNGPDQNLSYEAMVGINLPIQTGRLAAQSREAAAMEVASQNRYQAALLQVEADLSQAVVGLRSLIEIEKLLRESSVPQSRLAYEAALSAYEFGRADANAVLIANRRVRDAQLQLLAVQVEAQLRLAELERVLGEQP